MRKSISLHHRVRLVRRVKAPILFQVGRWSKTKAWNNDSHPQGNEIEIESEIIVLTLHSIRRIQCSFAGLAGETCPRSPVAVFSSANFSDPGSSSDDKPDRCICVLKPQGVS